jgi:hypothetical protein
MVVLEMARFGNEVMLATKSGCPIVKILDKL